MPFTFAHPGFTLPFKKWKPVYFSATGLVFGSIAPDMDILLRFTNPRFHIFQYDIKCVVLYIFPIALILSIYFHLVMRNIFIDHLPDVLADKFRQYKTFHYFNYLKQHGLIVVTSIFFAIYLHLFLDFISHWDAFPFKVYGWHYYHSYWMGFVYYYTAIYAPAVILTIAGFYFIGQTLGIRISDITTMIKNTGSDRSRFIFYGVLLFFGILIAFIKTAITGIEKAFIIDSLVINFTNGLMLSCMITPLFYLIGKKLNLSHG